MVAAASTKKRKASSRVVDVPGAGAKSSALEQPGGSPVPLAPPAVKRKLNDIPTSITTTIQLPPYGHSYGGGSDYGPAPFPAAPLTCTSSYEPPREGKADTEFPLPSKSMERSAARKRPTAKSVAQSQNPFSTSRGLKHFSLKVCEKVAEKGTTTYGAVADELVREMKEAEAAIARAAADRGEDVPVKKRKTNSKNAPQKTDDKKDDKNIRRRVYDALNVLMALDVITKEKKDITWRGMPGSNFEESEMQVRYRSERIQQLRDTQTRAREEVKRKRRCLEEMMVHNVCVRNLLERNHAREVLNNPIHREASNRSAVVEEDAKIPLPFLIVNTDSSAEVQFDMCSRNANVSFECSLPFEVNDDNAILKKLGMDHTSREVLQRLLPPDMFYYLSSKGLLDGITRARR